MFMLGVKLYFYNTSTIIDHDEHGPARVNITNNVQLTINVILNRSNMQVFNFIPNYTGSSYKIIK